MSQPAQGVAVVDVKRVKTPEGILSYPFLHTAQPERDDKGKVKEGGKLQFSLAIIFRKEADLAALKTAAFAAATEKWGDKAKEMIESGALKWPFRKDGATKGYTKVAGEGCIFINARSTKRPGTVHRIAQPGTTLPMKIEGVEAIEKMFYPGAHVRATIRAFAYSNIGKGVSWSLENVQWLGDGERLDNRVDAQDDFEADLSAAPANIDSLV